MGRSQRLDRHRPPRFAAPSQRFDPRWDGPCQYETSYHCAEVVADTARPSGRLLILDRGHNSYVDLEDPTHLEFRYIRVMADLIDVEMPSGPLDVVSIGGGGFTLPGYLAATRPGSDHRVLEIDASLVDIGRRHLGFEDEAEVIIDDARRSITEIAPGSVDVVVGDAFTGLTVPWHLTTVEFVEMIGDIAGAGRVLHGQCDRPARGEFRPGRGCNAQGGVRPRGGVRPGGLLHGGPRWQLRPRRIG